MTDDLNVDRLVQWADHVLDDYARLSEHLTDEELREREVIETAEFYTLAGGWWLIAHPDDPAMRRYLIEDEYMEPDFVDAVLSKMRELEAQWPSSPDAQEG